MFGLRVSLTLHLCGCLCSCLKLFHKAVLKCQVLGSIATGVQRLIVDVFVEANNNWHTHNLFLMCICPESMFYTHFPTLLINLQVLCWLAKKSISCPLGGSRGPCIITLLL